MSAPREPLLRRALRFLLRRFGEEDIALAVPERMRDLPPGFVADESAWRGWRIERSGPRLSIRRSYPWWESVLRGGEVNPRGNVVQFVGVLLHGGFAFEYWLDGAFVPMPGGLALQGRIRVRGFKRPVLLVFFALAGLVFPALLLAGAAHSAVPELAAAWPDAVAMAGVLGVAAASLVVALAVVLGLLGVLLALVFIMRGHGEPSRKRLLAFLSRLIAEAAARTDA